MERFPARGATALNVHEASRLALRSHLAETSPGRFRLLSARAAGFFANDLRPAGRIEWIFHRLSADPERGATELGQQSRSWSGTAKPEDQYALAAALQELDDAQQIHGRARAWALLVIAWARTLKGETAQLGAAARTALQLARTAKDLAAEGEAQCLLGDVLQTQCQLAAAQEAFGQALAISRRLAEQDPSNAGWQRELAVAHSRVGDVLRSQGQLAAAQEAYGQYLAISRRLTEQDHDNAGWPSGLAAALRQVGGVRQAQGQLAAAQGAFQLAEAQEAYGLYFATSRCLAEQDPSNAGWQRGLAEALWWLASCETRGGRGSAALSLYEEGARILTDLVEKLPDHPQFREDLESITAEMDAVRGQIASE